MTLLRIPRTPFSVDKTGDSRSQDGKLRYIIVVSASIINWQGSGLIIVFPDVELWALLA